ncbi:hypothetical protein [Streptomyces rubiginosohelvolus]|uniref:hypothetical protein n=1 Tax=Streptomyces rubiginosohelvolus TaxID=67362 RepID=UPI00380522CC
MSSPFGPAPFDPAADRAQHDTAAYWDLVARSGAALHTAAADSDVNPVLAVLGALHHSTSAPMTGAADITHHLLVALHEDTAHPRTPTGAFDIDQAVSSDQPDVLATMDIAARLGHSDLTPAEQHCTEATQALDICRQALALLASDRPTLTRRAAASTAVRTLPAHGSAAGMALVYAWAALRTATRPGASTPG